MSSETIDLLKKIVSKYTANQVPTLYRNTIAFEVPNEEITFKISSKEIVLPINIDTYNDNQKLFEQFKDMIYSNYPTDVKPLTNYVYILIKNSDKKNYSVEISFND